MYSGFRVTSWSSSGLVGGCAPAPVSSLELLASVLEVVGFGRVDSVEDDGNGEDGVGGVDFRMGIDSRRRPPRVGPQTDFKIGRASCRERVF